MSDPLRICFLADRHDLYDDRIYWKMAVPLLKRGYEVYYLLIGDRDETGTTQEGIIYRMFKIKTFSQNRFLNFVLKRLNPWNNYKLMHREATTIEANIYHFHDLWINRIGPKLKRLAHKPVVFYDAREPYAEDYLSYVKTRFSLALYLFAYWLDNWEKKKARHYDLVIANELNVQQNFAKALGENRSVVLYNYTDRQLEKRITPLHKKEYDLIYCGAISELRGALDILKAVKLIQKELPQIKVLFLGNYFPSALQDDMLKYLKENGLVDAVVLKNAVPYKEVARYYRASKIGLVVLHKVKTFEISMPIKLFEYMAFGLPVIGSDFGHIKDYIRKDNCGITVAPNDHTAIAKAAIRMLKDPDLYEQYSTNGRRASQEKYRWEIEFEKLVVYYNKALNEH